MQTREAIFSEKLKKQLEDFREELDELKEIE